MYLGNKGRKKVILKWLSNKRRKNECSYAISLQGREKSVRKSSIRALRLAVATMDLLRLGDPYPNARWSIEHDVKPIQLVSRALG